MLQLYKNIKELRKEKGLTQSDLAAKAGYSDKGMISYIESGKVDLPFSKIEIFAKIFEISMSELMGNDGCTDSFNEYSPTLSPSENQLVDNYRQLNPEGRERLLEDSEMYVASGRYKKSCSAGVDQKEA